MPEPIWSLMDSTPSFTNDTCFLNSVRNGNLFHDSHMHHLNLPSAGSVQACALPDMLKPLDHSTAVPHCEHGGERQTPKNNYLCEIICILEVAVDVKNSRHRHLRAFHLFTFNFRILHKPETVTCDDHALFATCVEVICSLLF